MFPSTAEDFKPFHLYGYILECLDDLNERFKNLGSKLHIFKGCPLAVFRYLHSNYKISKVSFEQDPEPIWHPRDNAVKSINCK